MADRKISDLTALTTPASGDYLPIVDISEIAAASKNKRITIEELMRGAPSGTAAAPSIAFESDPNTGIYSPGADQLAIATGGTGRLFVSSAGNVGIGTSSPQSALQVGGSTSTSQVRIYGGTAGSSYPELMLYGASSDHNWTIRGNHSTSLTIGKGIAGSYGSDILTILSAGLVGIGTSSPSSALHLYGAPAELRVESSTSSDGFIRFTNTSGSMSVGMSGAPSNVFLLADRTNGHSAYQYGGGASGYHIWHTNNTERARIDSSGRLLVGTSTDSGGSLLQINGNRIRIATAKTPASATDTGTTGEICWDASYIYVCTATNTWKRTAIATW